MIVKQSFYFGHKKRPLHIYLPDDYNYSSEHYPVIYFFDGHNLFRDEDATYGKSWGLSDFLDHYDKKLIVVGLECSHRGNERLHEYCPYHVNGWLGELNGYGEDVFKWIINKVKPYIDQNYRTMPFRECTMIAGSSMGGLMALYGVIAHNIYFSKAAVISPSIPMCERELVEEFYNSTISADTRVYFSSGYNESKGSMDRSSKVFEELFRAKGGITLRRHIPDSGHCEADWERQNGDYLDFLWKG